MTERRTDRRAWAAVADLEAGLRLVQKALDEINPAYASYAMNEYEVLRLEAHLVTQMHVARDIIKDALEHATEDSDYSYLLEEDISSEI
jgi:hypothetical protein